MNIKSNKNLWNAIKALLKELCSCQGFDEDRTEFKKIKGFAWRRQEKKRKLNPK